MKIKICVGSSCHLCGSKMVIDRLKALVAEHNMEKDLELSASFCLSRCSEGVSVVIDDEKYYNLRPNEVDTWFEAEVLGKGAVK